MKLLRVGDKDREKVAAIDKNGAIRDISSVIDDLDPKTINFILMSSGRSHSCLPASIFYGVRVSISYLFYHPALSDRFLPTCLSTPLAP